MNSSFRHLIVLNSFFTSQSKREVLSSSSKIFIIRRCVNSPLCVCVPAKLSTETLKISLIYIMKLYHEKFECEVATEEFICHLHKPFPKRYL